MWKEKYKTGVDIIDAQHRQLFYKSDELLHAIDRQSDPAVYQEIITFLKEYVKLHFQSEESYQRSIQYPGYARHKQAHDKFTNLVHDYAQKLEQNNYAIELVKELAGTLTAWLIYHVVHTDLKMVQGKGDAADVAGMSNIQILTHSLRETLEALTGRSASGIGEQDAIAQSHVSGIQISVDLFGDVNGTATYIFTEEIAKNLFQCMTMQQPQSIDAMVYSALSEITNITTGRIAVRLAENGLNCDIKPPRILDDRSNDNYGGVILDTGIGKIEVSAVLDNY